MFSVNIDKLVAMSGGQVAAYEAICDSIVKEADKKTVAVMGTGMVAFKIAAGIAESGRKVIFIDGDFSTSVFLGKYRLGKNLNGACEYIAGEQPPQDIICKTNRSNFEIVFTGNVEERNDVDTDSASFKTLIDTYKAGYDTVVVAAGASTGVAKKCDGVVVVMDDAQYSEAAAKETVDKLMQEGCSCMGVVLENCS